MTDTAIAQTPGDDSTADLAFMPAVRQAKLIREHELSPVELVRTYLDRIERLNPQLGCYITVAADHARADARRAEQRVMDDGDLPPFLGIPLSVKDLVDTAGVRTTCATAAWTDRVPDTSAAVITKMEDAGFIVIGKSNTPEFAGGIYTEPAAYGPCRNPWDPDYTPGGSSGGAGASLAAGLCSVAHGTDDGGSVRIPAGWCGLLGLKPSRGRVSAAPDPQAFEFTHGPLGRTVADVAGMLDAMEGYVTGDAFWAPPPARPFADEVGRDPGSLRIAWTTRGADGVDIAPGNKEGTRKVATALEELGHRVEEVDDWPGRGLFPDERALPLHVMYGVKYAWMSDAGLMPPVKTLEPSQQLLVELGREARATDFARAQHLAAQTSRAIVSFFGDHDVLLTPVIACRPTRIGFYEDHPEEALAMLHAVQFTAQFSVTGQPALAVPAGLDAEGLPVGAQLVGRPADEATLVRLAAQLEAARPWHHRRPPLATGVWPDSRETSATESKKEGSGGR